MNPERTYEQHERRRRILRWIFLTLAVSLSGGGFCLLNVSPDTALEIVVSRVFWGITLLVAGFFVAMVSRLVL
jgi:hypothetical protein